MSSSPNTDKAPEEPSNGGVATRYVTSLMTRSKSDCINVWIEVVDAIRTPSIERMTTLSIPGSSVFNIASKSPIVCVTGLSTKMQGSFRDGNGTVRCGRPVKDNSRLMLLLFKPHFNVKCDKARIYLG